MVRNLEELIGNLEAKYSYNVFGTDIKKDEVEANETFFIINPKGEIRKAQSNTNQYLRNFYIYFVTKSDAEIDEIELAESLRKHGLRFDGTDIEYGKVAGTDSDAKMITFIFHTAQVVCK